MDVPQDSARILIRFRGAFHEIPEGGTFPVGLCPFHPWRLALYVPEGFATPYGPVDEPGWSTAFFHAREVGTQFEAEPFRNLEKVPTRAAAESFLLGGSDFGPCDHFTPKQIAGAASLVDSAAFVHPYGACMKLGHHGHDAIACAPETRPPGLYWVKVLGEWTVGEWYGDVGLGGWEALGFKEGAIDSDSGIQDLGARLERPA